jgi:hypothetical protein
MKICVGNSKRLAVIGVEGSAMGEGSRTLGVGGLWHFVG